MECSHCNEAKATHLCAGCAQVVYCGVECARADWNTQHRLECISHPVSASKARKILRDGHVKGHPLTDKQRRYFGWLAGGGH